ncbi:putative E3 ubiquitin-protein ligase RING1a [Vicia villosa]|uniref:putative E3 ubiquitin-protein ligase RING1a n=1 Tax=Vicia villosa TaxID=3911 RepID=UPI00273B6A72|nr:putative E3 ubiquitin-protein ligase RING1a [Vicia villosa]
MSENQHSLVVEESLQENKETNNEEKPEDELDLTQKHSSENGEEAEKVDEEEEEEEEEEEGEEDEEEGEEEKKYVVLDLPSLRKEIECPICLGIIRNTNTVMECLHRFCRECIHKSMRHGNKECPTCRVHCPSKRSVRDDPSFDAIIQLICPNIDEFEKQELAYIEKELDQPNKKVP